MQFTKHMPSYHPTRYWPFVRFLMLAGVCIYSHPALAANAPTLVLNDPTSAPFTTAAGDGFFDIVLGEAFRRAGLQLKLIKVPAERALINANAGIEDGDISRIAGLEKHYPNLVRVPEAILNMHFVAFTQQNLSSEATWATLQSRTVGHIRGWKIFEQNLLPATAVTTAEGPDQLFTMLSKNRIEIALYDRWMGYALAKQMNMPDVHVIEPPLAEREMFVYLHQRHSDKVPAIAAALRAIKSEGMYTKICREKLAPLAPVASQCEAK